MQQIIFVGYAPPVFLRMEITAAGFLPSVPEIQQLRSSLLQNSRELK